MKYGMEFMPLEAVAYSYHFIPTIGNFGTNERIFIKFGMKIAQFVPSPQ
jgi:hypothetical protein